MIQGNFYGCDRCLVQCVYIVVSGIDRSTLGLVNLSTNFSHQLAVHVCAHLDLTHSSTVSHVPSTFPSLLPVYPASQV